ncbi:MAG: hypothetical protein D6715_09010 [Calditrichaeota bacterium]|nr:MAG: hypothetical protein D6715_09010 [Calditrichota bacterium]
MNLILENVTMPFGPLPAGHVEMADGRIAAVVPATDRPPKGRRLALDGALVFPGLINSHDHLAFNAFPPLGEGPYRNFLDWSRDIHRRFSQIIARVKQIPLPVRVGWGMLKNLLCGVTVVAHHGAWPAGASNRPIGLVAGSQSLHSLALERHWRWKLLFPELFAGGRREWPVVVHLAEGVDAARERELPQLVRWNWRRRPLIAVHGIALKPGQAGHLRALVWCPVSNLYLYGATAPVSQLKRETTILLGSDATLTGSWNFWEHLRQARALGQLDDQMLFQAVTASAARVWQLPGGHIAPGGPADLVVARRVKADPVEAFFALNPTDILLVMRSGRAVLWDAELDERMAALGYRAAAEGWLNLAGRKKWVALNVADLLRNTPPDLLPLPIAKAG